MSTRVECSCGWTRELSRFYAGKRIRCADCGTVLEVPGVSSGFYSSPGLERELNRKPGTWMPLAHSQASSGRRQGVSRHLGNSIFFIMVAVIVALNIGRILQDDACMRQLPSNAPIVEPAVDGDHESPEQKPAPADDARGTQPQPDAEREDEF